MKIARRPQDPRLRPFVRTIWATEPAGKDKREPQRELVLPTGDSHLVFRLADRPLRIFRDAGDPSGSLAGVSLVGGARTSPYLRDVSEPVPTVGAQLMPGASHFLLGVPAVELAEAHNSLDDLWGSAARDARERLAAAPSLKRRLDLFESILASRLPAECAPHPIVFRALPVVARQGRLREVVEASGYSHRHFVALFRQEVGVSPKVYHRLQRFQRALLRIAAAPATSLSSLALDAGYSDQSHFNRDFRAFAGLAPGDYRLLSPAQPNHLPLPPRPQR